MVDSNYNFGMIINDLEVSSNDNRNIEVVNPANGEIIGSVPLASEDDINKAVCSAQKAFEIWGNTFPDVRSEKMIQAAEVLEKRVNEIGYILTLEQGKPLKEAIGEVKTFVAILRFYAEEAKRIEGCVIQGKEPFLRSLVVKEPIGVTAVICPWNYPLALLALKLGPALAAGCTVVVKPATETPLSTVCAIKSIIEKKCFPLGTINVVTGKGSEIGDFLTNNNLIQKISFTGSTNIGKLLLNNSIGGIKRLSLELGGNSPFIVWEDADINLAVRDSVSRSFKNAGQICNSVNRIYVHEKIFNLFIEKFTEKTKKLKIGNGFNENVDIGPMATQEGVKGIIKQIHDAVEKGAKLMWGGRKPQGKEFEKGYFFEPTILINTNHKMLIMKEESFGPVVGIMPVKDFEQVISLSNDTKYGLVAYAYTEDLSRAYQLSEKLKTGTVCINNIAPINLKAPYGGIKESGIGVESSKIAIDEYLNIKHICIKV